MMKNQVKLNQGLIRRIGHSQILIVIGIVYFLILLAIIILLDPFLYGISSSHLQMFIYVLHIGSGLLISSILFLGGVIVYFFEMLDVTKIPKTSSLYDAIMSLTVQEGPVKVIFPILDEEIILEELEDS
ncbi:MAG: hypothetical protein ACFFAJ_16605 [Candidatus Hodarchaeota archaeon]